MVAAAAYATHQVARDAFHRLVQAHAVSESRAVTRFNSNCYQSDESEQTTRGANDQAATVTQPEPLHGREAGVSKCGDVQRLVQIIRLNDRIIIEVLGLEANAAAGQGVQEHGHHA
jgi:hypothetical protein